MNSRSKLESMTCVELKNLLEKKGLKKGGNRADLIDRLVMDKDPSKDAKSRKKKAREKDPERNKNTHAQTQQSGGRAKLETKTCQELKDLLKEKGLSKTGTKKVLVDQLMGMEPVKPQKWQYSEAKKDLKKLLEDQDSSIEGKSVAEIYQSDKRYEEWGLKKFEKHYESLKEKVEKRKQRINLDDVAVMEHKKNFPRGTKTKRGYPHWNSHPASELLETDIVNGLHEGKTPSELRLTRDAYKEFPKDVFTKRVHREITKQTGAKFWASKRNKKGMKKYLADLEKKKHL